MWTVFMALLHLYSIGCTIFGTIILFKVYKEYKVIKAEEEVEEELADHVDLKIEKEKNHYYMYHTTTLEFITQAATEEEVIQKAKEIFSTYSKLHITKDY